VFNSNTGTLALDLMCGSWGAALCTAKRWFDFMGGEGGNPYTTFRIFYNASNVPEGGLVPLDTVVTPCNEPVKVRSEGKLSYVPETTSVNAASANP